jgi:chemotaxis protein MotB
MADQSEGKDADVEKSTARKKRAVHLPLRARGRGSGREAGEHDAAGGMRWLLTYADVITLLLALFIFLFSISSVDTQKLRNFIQEFGTLFGIFQGGRSPIEGGRGILPGGNTLVELEARFSSELSELIEKRGLAVVRTKDGLTIRVPDVLLFQLGKASLLQGSKAALDNIIILLKSIPNDVRVEGHTDTIPIRTPEFPSNWELSGGRAAAVARYLIEVGGIDPRRVAIVGYGQYRPVEPNDPARGNPKNRRVDIVVLLQK